MSKPSWIKPHLAARLAEAAAAQTNKSQGATYSDPNIELVRGIPVGYHVDPNAPKGDPNAQLKQELRRIMEGIGLPTLPASSGAPLTRGEQELLKDIKAAGNGAGGSNTSTTASASGAVTSVTTSSGLILKVGDKVRDKRWHDKIFYPITRFEGKYLYLAYPSGKPVTGAYHINECTWEIEPRVEAWDPMTEPLKVGDKVEVVFRGSAYKGQIGYIAPEASEGNWILMDAQKRRFDSSWGQRKSLKLLEKAA